MKAAPKTSIKKRKCIDEFNVYLINLSQKKIPEVTILHSWKDAQTSWKFHRCWMKPLITSLIHNHKWSHRKINATYLAFPSLHLPILNRYLSLTSQNNPIKWTYLWTCVFQCNLNMSRIKSFALLLLHVSKDPIHLQRFTRCLFLIENSCKCSSTSHPK